MTEHEQNASQQRAAAERLARARQQLAAATSEFQKALAAVRDPARRRELTGSYVALLQKALAAAQQGLDRYSQHRSSQQPAGDRPPDSAPGGQDTTTPT